MAKKKTIVEDTKPVETAAEVAQPSTEDLMKIIAGLQQQIAEMQNNNTPEPAAPVAAAKKGRKVSIVNLSADTLFLNGQQSHTLKPFTSTKVSEKEAEKIYENWPEGCQSGVYTFDSQFIRDQDIDIPENVIFDPKEIQSVLNLKPEEAEKKFLAMAPEQRGAVVGIINNMIANTGLKNTDTVYKIGEMIGKDYRELNYRMGV